VQANPNSSFSTGVACRTQTPNGVVALAIQMEFGNKRIALEHLNWYLGKGAGADFVEDANLDNMLRTEPMIQSQIKARIPTGSTARVAFSFPVEQSDYVTQDLRFAFGAIDRLDVEVDVAAGTVHAWFQDRYEWHPVYPFYTKLAGDVMRETNCVHAASVELKSGGARDYWMKGEVTLPLSALAALPVPAPTSSSNNSV
jgi:hypothetical protein